MINQLIVNNPILANVIIIGLIVLVGYLEWRILALVDLACATWFFAMLICCATLIKLLGFTLTGWIVSFIVLFVTVILLSMFRRRHEKKQR